MKNNDIHDLLLVNKEQMSYDEYDFICSQIAKKSPINLLIFGLGKDSILWDTLNKNGLTLFIEDDVAWVDKIKKTVPNSIIETYEYFTKNKYISTYFKSDNPIYPFRMNLDPRWYNTHWDMIILDGPTGWGDECPGRFQPMATVTMMDFDLLCIHDCERWIENLYSRVCFGNQFKQIDKLRIYKKN